MALWREYWSSGRFNSGGVADMTIVGADDLYGELSAHQRRRLYFLFVALNKVDPEAAIEVAERMERFVTSSVHDAADDDTDQNDDNDDDAEKGGTDISPQERRAVHHEVTLGHAQVGRANGHASNGDGRAVSAKTANIDAARCGSVVRKNVLDAAQRTEFEHAIASGADNNELATRFRLTRRQAHGLRIGYARGKAGATAKRPEDCKPSYDAAAERQQQESFLRDRPPQPPTIDDVVRFLRQQGDVIVRNGDGYMVNYSLALSAEELVARANRKRTANGKPPFELAA
jgi:hypothetical protein